MKLSGAQKADGLVIAGWSIFVLIYFLPKLIAQAELPHSTLWYAEATQQAIPFWKFSAGMLERGLMPLWSPHFFCGYPYIAFPWNSLFYPAFYLVYRLPYITAVYIESIYCFILAGYFSYFCFRRMLLGPAASLAGMLVIITGGYFTHYSVFYCCYREWYFAMTCWALAGLIYNRPSLKYFIFLALGAGLSMGMDVEKAFYLEWFYLGWVLYSSPPGRRVKRLVLVGLGMALGYFLIGAAPVLNIAGFFSHSIRSEGITFDGFLANQLPWQTILAGFLPADTSLVNPFNQFYLGVVATVLAVFGVKRLGKRAVGSVIALLLYALYSMGEPHFLKIFYQLPVFNRTILHYGAGVVIFMIFSGWAAFGMQEISSKPGSRRFLVFLSAVIAALIALEILGLETGRVKVLLLTGRSLSQAWVKGLAEHWFRPFFLAGLLAAGLALAGKRKIIPERTMSVFMICLVIFDLSFLALATRPSAPKELFEPGNSLKSIMRDNGFDRFWPVTQKALEDFELVSLMGMQMDPLVKGAHTPIGYMRLLPRRVTDIINLLAPGYTRYDRDGKLEGLKLTFPLQLERIDPKAEKIMSLLNVGIIISRGIKLETDWPAREQDGFVVYKNPAPLPRAFMVGSLVRAKTGPGQLDLFSDPGLDFARTAIVDEDFPFQIDTRARSGLRLLKFRPGYWEFEVEVQGQGPQLFFLSEDYYPGWKAFVDGVEQRIHRVNYTFIGLAVPPGRRHLKLQFEPESFHIGMWASLSSYFSLVMFGLVYCFSRRRVEKNLTSEKTKPDVK